ncbi:phage major capsid protein [Adlercreutzia caecimuris]|uniref:Phage major capsid protein n=1 Tax=Adlercreutzia caecimuris TaxID=671266 RepID=A0A4S4G095_9ACTN|nr:phage major capsid protein [Adlercreutzia caecimuris]THG36840.1 phage major capsid protein [Adlercreutzia caecimuris]
MNRDQIIAAMRSTLDKMKAADSEESFKALQGEYDDLQKQLARIDAVESAEKMLADSLPVPEQKDSGDADADADAADAYEKACKSLAAAARKGFNEGTPADGGYTVPEDIQTKINQWKTVGVSLDDLVSTENVKTKSGERTYQKRGAGQGFSSIKEGGKLPKVTQPQFERIKYEIEKFGGYMFATNELLDDTDANIVGTIIEWFAENRRVTRNRLILAGLNSKYTRDADPETAKAISSLDDIKKIINVDLGQTFAPTTKIVTNDDGLQWLDTLKDKDGNSLLKDSEKDPLTQYVSIGFRRVPLRIVPNEDLPTDPESGIPVFIGDFRESVRLYDRNAMSIMASNTAAVGTGEDAINAFDEDLTIWRGLLRLDVEPLDEKAWHKGHISPASSAANAG